MTMEQAPSFVDRSYELQAAIFGSKYARILVTRHSAGVLAGCTRVELTTRPTLEPCVRIKLGTMKVGE